MLSIEDCIAFSDLTEEEIDAIAEHEHVPEIVAAEMGAYLVQTESGEARIQAMIVDDIRHAQQTGNFRHAAKLKLCLKHYLESHAPKSAR